MVPDSGTQWSLGYDPMVCCQPPPAIAEWFLMLRPRESRYASIFSPEALVSTMETVHALLGGGTEPTK